MKCDCDKHVEYCDICFPPEKRRSIVKPRNGKPLTDVEMRQCANAMDAEPLSEGWKELIKFARAIERAHGIIE